VVIFHNVFKCWLRDYDERIAKLVGTEEMAGIYELLGVFVTSFILNIIPFAGPSNLFIASHAAMITDADPFTIGSLVALASASAKFIHYLVTFFISGLIGKERRQRLNSASERLRRWAPIALFVVAATPLPDEPVVIPLGVLKYNPVKFFVAFFFGKLSITIVGAYLGLYGQVQLAPFVNETYLMIASIILTVVLTVILLKVDVTKIAERILKRKLSWD
jgi:membrane protein DedA with SNARE-associated domain